MISPKHLAGLILGGLLLVSCTPAYPPGHRPDGPPMNPAIGPAPQNQKTIAQLERELAERKAQEKARKEAQARAAAEAAQGNNPVTNTGGSGPTVNDTTPPPPVNANNKKTNYRTARSIPGKPGYVFNPWTLEPVDVRGIPSGSLVQDPNDPNKANHRFRVP